MSFTSTPHGCLAEQLPEESRDSLPGEVIRLLSPQGSANAEAAWTAFVAVYSGTLLRVATAFAPGYDGALDRYAYMLEELRRHDHRRIRRFVADGRGRFSTWLAVVARRLCLDHYRRCYGRFRGAPTRLAASSATRTARRHLVDLAGTLEDLTRLEDTSVPDPGDDLDAEARRGALARAVAALAPPDQLLLRLRFEEGLSAREIAGLLGLPTPFHVYRRLETVCASLRDRLQPAPQSPCSDALGTDGAPPNPRPQRARGRTVRRCASA